jgi:hypothetical protein
MARDFGDDSFIAMARICRAVKDLCAAIDAGEVQPEEGEIVALAQVVCQQAGPMAHDLVCMLASRCVNGRIAMKEIAQ